MKTSALRITLGCLTCLALLMTFSNSSAQAPTSPVPPILPQWAVAEPLPPAPEFQEAPLRPGALEPPPPGAGFIPPPMDLSHLTGQRMPEGAVLQPLPDIFDWRNKGGSNYVTSVKNQSTCGSCYSFAAIGNIESKMVISGGIAYPGPDYSENNAKECNWRELNNFQYPNPGDYWGSCDGGNYYMLASLFSQKGTVLETCDPYVASDVTCNSSCPYRKTLLDWHIISDGVPDTNVLKHYIYDNGPVYVSMYTDETEGFDNSYNGSFTFNYTTPGPDTNHAVLIVGWSNDLPPVPGDTSPADGWIVKNSWGPTWGASGYFYITYGAANIGTSSSFIAGWQDYDTNGDIWYYDDDGWWSSFGETGGANTTAWGLAKFAPDSNTNVTRVEFWTTDATTDVDVYIYDDFDGTTLSTLLASKLNNSFGEAGYHSVELDSPLAVTNGDDVVAVVKFTNDSNGYPVAVDQHGPIETARTYISISGGTDTWTDLGGLTTPSDAAIRLRTSTSVAPAPTVTSITPASGINTGTVHITDLAGTNFQTGATVKLAKLGQTDIAGTSVTVVNSNTITCDFDLTGAATGQWNVVVTNPDLQSGMLPNGFTVNPSPTAPTVTSITPASGINTGTIHITNLAGTNFQTGATVNLAKLGQTDIAGASVTVVSSNTITCDFDLTGAATGQWNVVVTNPDLQSGMLPNGFTVNASGEDTYVYLPLVCRCWPLMPYVQPISNPDGDGLYTVSWTMPPCGGTPSSYEFQSATNPQFTGATGDTTSNTYVDVYSPTPATYYWRVRAYISGQWTDWSNVQSVTVGSFSYVWVDNDTGGTLTIEIVGIETRAFASGFDGYWRSVPVGWHTVNATARCGSSSNSIDFPQGEFELRYYCASAALSTSMGRADELGVHERFHVVIEAPEAIP